MTNNPSGANRASVALAVLAAVLLVAAVVFFGLRARAAYDEDHIPDEQRATFQYGEAEERDAVLDASREFAAAMNEFSPADLEGQDVAGFRERVEPLLTDKFTTSFENEAVPFVQALVDQHGATSTAEVLAAGVVELSEDSARTLVTGEIRTTVAKGERAGEAVPSLIRYQVELLKIGGAWLVDDFTPVVEGGAA